MFAYCSTTIAISYKCGFLTSSSKLDDADALANCIVDVMRGHPWCLSTERSFKLLIFKVMSYRDGLTIWCDRGTWFPQLSESDLCFVSTSLYVIQECLSSPLQVISYRSFSFFFAVISDLYFDMSGNFTFGDFGSVNIRLMRSFVKDSSRWCIYFDYCNIVTTSHISAQRIQGLVHNCFDKAIRWQQSGKCFSSHVELQSSFTFLFAPTDIDLRISILLCLSFHEFLSYRSWGHFNVDTFFWCWCSLRGLKVRRSCGGYLFCFCFCATLEFQSDGLFWWLSCACSRCSTLSLYTGFLWCFEYVDFEKVHEQIIFSKPDFDTSELQPRAKLSSKVHRIRFTFCSTRRSGVAI